MRINSEINYQSQPVAVLHISDIYNVFKHASNVHMILNKNNCTLTKKYKEQYK